MFICSIIIHVHSWTLFSRKQLVLASESADAKEEQLRQLREDLATVQSQTLHNEGALYNTGVHSLTSPSLPS